MPENKHDPLISCERVPAGLLYPIDFTSAVKTLAGCARPSAFTVAAFLWKGLLPPAAALTDVARRATATDAAPKIVFVICILAVVARLIFINQPYVDHWSWRQSDVAAIARNFLQNGFRFGYPEIDWAGNAPGFVGTETTPEFWIYELITVAR